MKKNYFHFMEIKNSVAVAALLLLSVASAKAQSTKLNVLFVGNSFTSTNDLPGMVKQVSNSVGDSIFTSSIAPGGFTLQQHSTNAATLSAIAAGSWNYVVLQEQSQLPSFPDKQVDTAVYPYAIRLDSMVHATNKCGRTVFYQTWGYRDGDAMNCPVFPPVCTYEGMDSLLALRYDMMANMNRALLSPVGSVFKAIRTKNPGMNLYAPDGIHPSVVGTYAAAVTFYTILFGKNPKLITFSSSVIPPDAMFIRQVVFDEVFTFLPKFYVGTYNPKADFTSTVTSPKVDFNSGLSENVGNYNWSFGDGGTSTLANPSHTYASPNTYTVKLVVDNCIISDSTSKVVTVLGGTDIKELTLLNSIEIFPNPATKVLNFKANFSTQSMSVSISNLLGAKVLTVNTLVNNTINIEQLSSGVYFIQLNDLKTGATIIRKFIKE